MTGDQSQTIHGFNRRTLLRSSLLTGLGVAAVGGASTLFTGTASAAQPAGVDPPGSNTPQQFDWGWCNACDGLFFADNAFSGGVCPAAASDGKSDLYEHAIVKAVSYKSFDYGIYHNGSGTDYQANWCYCGNCNGLFHQASGTTITGIQPNGVCPYAAGRTPHVNSGYPYLVYHGPISGVGQPNWRFCINCYGIFFAEAGATTGGVCPEYGGNKYPHNGSGSLPYQIGYNGSIALGPSITV
jgi:hypothetical protein